MAETTPGTSVPSRVDDPIISIKTLFKTVVKRVWIVILLCVLFCGLAVGLSVLQTPRYEASATILIGQGEGITQSPNEAVGLQQLTQTMATAADSSRIYEPVIEEFNLGLTPQEFEGRFSVQQLSATQFVEISYSDTNPDTAQQVTNALASEFSDQIDEISANSSQVTATIWTAAELPGEPVSPNPLRNGVLALFFGGVVGVGVALLLEFFDDSWSSPEEAERISGVPTFGVIPEFNALDRKKHKDWVVPWSSSGGQRGGRARSRAEVRAAKNANPVELPVGSFSMDPEGKVLFSNSIFREMLGVTEEDLDGQYLPDFASHPDDVEEHAKLNAQLLSGESGRYQVEKRMTRKDGELIWVRFNVSKAQDDNVAGEDEIYVGVVQDISEQKQAEERLRLSSESEKLSDERLRTLIDTPSSIRAVQSFTPDGFSLMGRDDWDALWKNGSSEGEAGNGNIFSNERAKRSGLTSYMEQSISRKELISTPPLEIAANGNPEEDKQWVQAFIRPIVDDSERVTEVWVTVEDITAVMKAEDELTEARRETERLYEALKVAEKENREEVRRGREDIEKSREELRRAQEAKDVAERQLGEFRQQFQGFLKTMSGSDDEERGR